jgi:SRSO17 transposase
MVGSGAGWRDDLERWLEPFLARLSHPARRAMCPLYVAGLIGPGDRKSVQPMAQRLGLVGSHDGLHHFVPAGAWGEAPLAAELLAQANRLVGGPDACLVIDDTALPKKGTSSVGVAPQYASALGKNANCQTLAPLTLAKGEVPVPLGLRLFLPEAWTSDPERMARAGVPTEHRATCTKPEIAIAELDRVTAAGARFGCVLADAGCGISAAFRGALSARGLAWAVGIPRTQKVFPADVAMVWPVAARGRPRGTAVPETASVAAEGMLDGAPWQATTWRRGTKGALKAEFAALRVRVADGPAVRIGGRVNQHLPGEEVWLVGERRSSGERKFYLANLPADVGLTTLAATIEARWVCEQAHQQLKEELGLDHFEGRSWTGLHRHALLTLIAFAFLQDRRLAAVERGGKGGRRRPAAAAEPTGRPTGHRRRSRVDPGTARAVPALPTTHPVAAART